MIKKTLIDNNLLLYAGLRLMDKEGKPLKKIPNKGRAMLYTMANGKTVRIRTCNDHLLVTVASGPEKGAKLSIEGTDYLLIVMPERQRTFGPVIAFLVPTEIAVNAVRDAHSAWLKSGPKTKGKNITWNIWFAKGGPEKSCGFFEKWAKYKIASKDIVSPSAGPQADEDLSNEALSLGETITASKEKIAKVAGVPVSAVKISVDLG